MQKKKKEIRIYGCGGAGINIASQYISSEPALAGEANLLVGLLDTSDANVLDGTAASDTYFIKGLEGSGGVRRENVDVIKSEVKQMLIDIPPADFNIVISSATGGSGSVIGPYILAELLSRKIPAVILTIGSDEDQTRIENNKKVLLSLDGIANAQKMPVVTGYYFNHRQQGRPAADSSIHDMIAALRILASGENDELDTKDVSNFFNYLVPRPELQPGLVIIELYTDKEALANVVAPISVASVYTTDAEDKEMPLMPPYSTTGYSSKINLTSTDRLYFVISAAPVAKMYSDIEERLNKVAEATKATNATNRRLTSEHLADDDGMCV